MNVRIIMKNLQKRMKVLLVLVAGVGSFSAVATPVFEFKMSGNTVFESFSISNFSTDGEYIKSIILDISGLGSVFDTIDNNGGTRYSKDFTPNNVAGIATSVLPTSGAVDNSTMLRAFFSDFNAGEKFLFDVDVDRLGQVRSSVYGNDLIGSLLTVEFSDGTFLSGNLGGVAGDDRAASLMLEAPAFAIAVNSPATFAFLALFPLIFMLRKSRSQLSK